MYSLVSCCWFCACQVAARRISCS